MMITLEERGIFPEDRKGLSSINWKVRKTAMKATLNWSSISRYNEEDRYTDKINLI